MLRIQRQSESFAYRLGSMTPEEKAARLPHWQPTVDALRDIGGRYRETPVPLKDGRTTNVYLDPKNVFSSGRHMNNLAKAMIEHAHALGIDYNAVGGPTMGADVISHSMVAHHPNPDMGWYTVRDNAKTHGLGKWIEGTEIGPNHNVILTDDVADSGKSLVDAYHKVRESGANVAAVMPVVERGDKTAAQFKQLGVPYHPLIHYNDLGIKTLSGPQQQPQQPGPPAGARQGSWY
jgi:orotate phosphoribosyltransferase